MPRYFAVLTKVCGSLTFCTITIHYEFPKRKFVMYCDCTKSQRSTNFRQRFFTTISVSLTIMTFLYVNCHWDSNVQAMTNLFVMLLKPAMKNKLFYLNWEFR